MSELPRGWCWAKLGELCSEGPRNGLSALTNEESGRVRILRLSATTQGELILDEATTKLADISVDDDSHLWIRNGDILIQRSNSIEYVGVAALVRTVASRVIYPDLMMKIRAVDELDPRFVWRQLNSDRSRKWLRSCATGTAGNMPKISGATLRQLPIAVPPLAEQRRIVAKLDKLLAHSRAAREALAAIPPMLERYRQSVLSAAFRGELTEGWREGQGDRSELMAWRTEALGDISEIAGGLTRNKSARADGAEVPILSVAAVQRMWIDLTAIATMKVLPEDGDRGTMLPGDLLLVEGNGSPANIGRVAVWEGQVPGARHQNHLIRVRPHSLPSRYLAHWLDSPAGRKELKTRAVSATGLYTLGAGKLAHVPVRVSSADESREIVRRVDAAFARIEKVRALVDAQLAKLEALDRALLARAFRGELVPQDPNDEPASEMLARVRAAREAAPVKAGRRGQTRG